MIGALLKGDRKEDAMDLFASISAYGLVLNIETYRLMAENLIEGSLEEFDGLFAAMEKSCTVPDSYYMLNSLVRRLLRRGDISSAGAYLYKLDEKNFSIEASTASMLISLFSREEYQNQAKSLPEKYCFLNGSNK
jgi:leucine-rich PPR motif-containing protein